MNKNQTPAWMTAALLVAAVINFSVSAMFSGGYVLTGAYGGASTVLIDSTGTVVFQWDHDNLTDVQGRLNGYSCYLLDNGNLLRSAMVPENAVVSVMAPRQGIIQEIDRAGNILWSYQLANDTMMLHHDMKPMPNGHILGVSFIVQKKDQMIATGVDTNLLKGMMGSLKFILSEKIIEIDPKAAGGPKIVWEWRMFEHVTPGDSAKAHPELFSGKISSTLFYTNQWVHLNGIDYLPAQDLILFSSRVFSELYIIDHSTTTEQASGHTGGGRGKGGDILYRWGKPANYKANGGTTINVLHCANWIPQGYPGAGNIIFFHNNVASGMPGPGNTQSQVIEIAAPMDNSGNFTRPSTGQAFGPAQPAWIFAPTDSFYSYSMSSALRLPNGNTLAHVAYPSTGGAMDISGTSLLVEVNSNKQVVSKIPLALKGEPVEVANPQKFNPAKIMFYANNHPGIIKLLGGGSGIHKSHHDHFSVSPSSRVRMSQTAGFVDFSNAAGCEIAVFNMQGKKVFSARPGNASFRCETSRFPPGLYWAKVSLGASVVALRMINIVQ